MIDFILILNTFFYFFSYKILCYVLKNVYYFPFRLRDLINFFLNIILFATLNFYFTAGYFFEIVTLNVLIFYFLFHVINMIETSPRTKILIELKNNNNISINKFKRRYSEIHIVKNRIKRFISTNQVYIKGNYILINDDKKISFLILIEKIFKLIKKI